MQRIITIIAIMMIYNIIIILFGCLILFMGNNILSLSVDIECKNMRVKPIIFNNLTDLLSSPEHINNAFSGKEPVIVKNMKDFCYPSIEKYVERDNLYVETFYNITNDNLIYKHFGEHFTMHAINNYGKKYRNGNIFHKDQYIPYTSWFKNKVPSLIREIELRDKHIVCSCKDIRPVLLINDVCSDKISKGYDNLHDLSAPQPIYIKNITKVLSDDITLYDFTLNENECLFFNPSINFHKFNSSDDNIAQIHFFILRQLSTYANYYPFVPCHKDKNKILKETQNRNVFQHIKTESELIESPNLEPRPIYSLNETKALINITRYDFVLQEKLF